MVCLTEPPRSTCLRGGCQTAVSPEECSSDLRRAWVSTRHNTGSGCRNRNAELVRVERSRRKDFALFGSSALNGREWSLWIAAGEHPCEEEARRPRRSRQ